MATNFRRVFNYCFLVGVAASTTWFVLVKTSFYWLASTGQEMTILFSFLFERDKAFVLHCIVAMLLSTYLKQERYRPAKFMFLGAVVNVVAYSAYLYFFFDNPGYKPKYLLELMLHMLTGSLGSWFLFGGIFLLLTHINRRQSVDAGLG